MMNRGRGRYKIFLGMAAGVGKTYRMLQEAQTLLRNGVDVKIGYIETHKRQETHDLLEGLPRVVSVRRASAVQVVAADAITAGRATPALEGFDRPDVHDCVVPRAHAFTGAAGPPARCRRRSCASSRR